MEKLQNICRWKREELPDSTYRVPEELKPEHGYIIWTVTKVSQNILIA